MYVGQTEKEIKALFTFAREYKAWHGYPLLIFMDECEVILPDRTGRVRRLAPWEESQVATFIAEMDGMQESGAFRSEEHTSELQSLMRHSYAVFCLKKKKH